MNARAARSCRWSELPWQEMPMPDANASTRLAALQPAGASQFLAMVEFPPGWERLQAGHYAVDEEFFVLSGDLHINGLCWHSAQFGFVPAHTLRLETRSVGGCTAYARFHGSPRWSRGSAAERAERPVARTADWRHLKPETCVNDISGRLLHRGACTSTWVLEAWPMPPAPMRGDAADALDLTNWNHFPVVSPAGPPAPLGPVLLHCFTAPTVATPAGI